MGYARSPSPHVIDAARGERPIRLGALTEFVRIFRAIDPFGIDDPCPIDESGLHQPVDAGDATVCWRCAKVFLP